MVRDDMVQCPDCDEPYVFEIPPRGNGKCGDCHGTGRDQGFLSSTIDRETDTTTPCSVCDGTGQCQTCGGYGRVKGEPEDSDEQEQESAENDDEISQVSSLSLPPPPNPEPSREAIPTESAGRGRRWVRTGLLACLVVVGVQAVVTLRSNSASAPPAKAAEDSAGAINVVGFPVCKDARVVHFKKHPVVEVEAHEDCMSGVFMMPVGPARIHFDQIGETPNAWLQVIYWDGTLSKRMFKDDPVWTGGAGIYLPIPHHPDDGFRIRGTGIKKISYEKLPGPTPPLPVPETPSGKPR